jgi:hypothetical protein
LALVLAQTEKQLLLRPRKSGAIQASGCISYDVTLGVMPFSDGDQGVTDKAVDAQYFLFPPVFAFDSPSP